MTKITKIEENQTEQTREENQDFNMEVRTGVKAGHWHEWEHHHHPEHFEHRHHEW